MVEVRDDLDYHDSKVIGVVLDPDTGDPGGLLQTGGDKPLPYKLGYK